MRTAAYHFHQHSGYMNNANNNDRGDEYICICFCSFDVRVCVCVMAFRLTFPRILIMPTIFSLCIVYTISVPYCAFIEMEWKEKKADAYNSHVMHARTYAVHANTWHSVSVCTKKSTNRHRLRHSTRITNMNALYQSICRSMPYNVAMAEKFFCLFYCKWGIQIVWRCAWAETLITQFWQHTLYSFPITFRCLGRKFDTDDY